MPEDRIADLIVRAEHFSCKRRAGLGMKQLERPLLQFVECDPVFFTQCELLLHGKTLGAVMQQRRDARLVHIRAVLFRKLHRRFLRAEHMRDPLCLQVGQRNGTKLLQL